MTSLLFILHETVCPLSLRQLELRVCEKSLYVNSETSFTSKFYQPVIVIYFTIVNVPLLSSYMITYTNTHTSITKKIMSTQIEVY